MLVELLYLIMNEYKFRAENKEDLDALLEIASDNGIQIDVVKLHSIERDLPDVEVSIKTTLQLRMLRRMMALVSDGHVMYQTVREPFLYTGNRDYDINLD